MHPGLDFCGTKPDAAVLTFKNSATQLNMENACPLPPPPGQMLPANLSSYLHWTRMLKGAAVLTLEKRG